MPQPVAELEHALPAFLAPHFIVGAEVGDVGEFLAHAQLRILAMQRDSGLQRSEMPREIEMLILRQMLIGKDQHRVGRERVFDVGKIGRRQRRRQIDVADFGGKARRDRTDGDGHGRCLPVRVFMSLPD